MHVLQSCCPYVYFCRQVGVLAVPVTVLVGNAQSVSLQTLYSTRRGIIVASSLTRLDLLSRLSSHLVIFSETHKPCICKGGQTSPSVLIVKYIFFLGYTCLQDACYGAWWLAYCQLYGGHLLLFFRPRIERDEAVPPLPHSPFPPCVNNV